MKNIPKVKIGIVAVSRDCFPKEIASSRRQAVVEAYNGELYEVLGCVENEIDMLKAVKELKENSCNALIVLLGNFGPETSEALFAKYFEEPVMYVGSAEETTAILSNNRGDAYCGMLNASYNLGLRNLNAYIPKKPIGTAKEIAKMIEDFVPLARTINGLKNLKIISFGPRPQDFLACNAPIKPLFDLGVEIQENSELDLFAAYNEHAGDKRIPSVIQEMEKELGAGNKMPGILPKLAQYEITLLDWMEHNKGSRSYVAFANKCWPAFQKQFGFVPCYANSRFTARGIPVSCEVDIYGALSEYIGACITEDAVTLLDINNTVPEDMYEQEIKEKYSYNLSDLFMAFHCGNTPLCKLTTGEMKYQLIMHRLNEPDKEPDITRGTLEGDIIPGSATLFRLQGTAEGKIAAYIAEGEFLPVQTKSFGGIGIFAVSEMERFYRYVLVAKRFPHHGAFVFGRVGKVLFDVYSYLGVTNIEYNRPKGMLYKNENPFC